MRSVARAPCFRAGESTLLSSGLEKRRLQSLLLRRSQVCAKYSVCGVVGVIVGPVLLCQYICTSYEHTYPEVDFC